MKKVFLLMSVILVLTFISCNDDDPKIIDPVVDVVAVAATCSDGIKNGDETGVDFGGSCVKTITVSGEITKNTIWTANNIYILGGKVVVGKGVTLTIEPGTIIKGKPGSGSLASALIVQRGSKIEAVGTAEKPIIFTAESDNIGVGQTAGTNLDENVRGLWGGLIVLGRASGSYKLDVKEIQIEGIPANDTFGLYGAGDALNDKDNSGTLKYISIRHGGALIGEGNEINGLTLGAVGSGTTIDNIEVVANVDDGIEFFGGTVNATNLIVWGCGDDGLDIDQAYSGTIDNAIVISGEKSDHSLEVDGPEGSAIGSFTLKNISLYGHATAVNGEYADYRSNAMGTTTDVYAVNFQDGKDVELDNNVVAQNFLDKKLVFTNWEVVGFDHSIFVEKFNEKKEETATIITNPDFTARATDWVTKVDKQNTVGADTSVFGWTYSNKKSNLGF